MRSRVVTSPSRAPCAALASGCYAPVCRQRGVPRRRTQHRADRPPGHRARPAARSRSRRGASRARVGDRRAAPGGGHQPGAVGVWSVRAHRGASPTFTGCRPRPRRVRRRSRSDHSPASDAAPSPSSPRQASRASQARRRSAVDDTGGVEKAVRLVQFIIGERPVLRLVRRDRCKSTLAEQVQRERIVHQRRHRPGTDFPLRALGGALMPMLA